MNPNIELQLTAPSKDPKITFIVSQSIIRIMAVLEILVGHWAFSNQNC